MVTINKSFRDQPVDHTHLTQREFSIFIFPSDLNLNKLDSKQPILTHAKKNHPCNNFAESNIFYEAVTRAAAIAFAHTSFGPPSTARNTHNADNIKK